MESPRKHHVGITAADYFGRFADRLAAGCTSCQAIRIGTLCVEQSGNVRRGQIGFLFQVLERVDDLQAERGAVIRNLREARCGKSKPRVPGATAG